MEDGQSWALIVLLATTMLGLFAEIRSERKEIRQTLQQIRGDLSEVKVTTARMDERLKGLEGMRG